MEFLKEKFNSGIKYNRKNLKWDTVILNKMQELGKFLLNKSKSIDFTQPIPNLERSDSLEIRKRILKMTQKEAINSGIKKSTLHYLRKHSLNKKSFKIYRKIATKLHH